MLEPQCVCYFIELHGPQFSITWINPLGENNPIALDVSPIKYIKNFNRNRYLVNIKQISMTNLLCDYPTPYPSGSADAIGSPPRQPGIVRVFGFNKTGKILY
jgi:hypothetical protein